jgi:tRNA threonylcarbamoyladenosine biosynthesis protein TsaE
MRLSAARRPALDILSHSPEQTRSLAAQLGKLLPRGSVVLLAGGIGAGKTTFVQGLARPWKLGDAVSSPTFTLVAEHGGEDTQGRPLRLYHMDLYRLAGVDDVDGFGFDDYLDDPNGLVVIEWPERARAAMPEEHLLIEFVPVADCKRSIRISPTGAAYLPIVERLRTEVSGGRR